MFSLCLRGFTPGTLLSFHIPKTWGVIQDTWLFPPFPNSKLTVSSSRVHRVATVVKTVQTESWLCHLLWRKHMFNWFQLFIWFSKLSTLDKIKSVSKHGSVVSFVIARIHIDIMQYCPAFFYSDKLHCTHTELLVVLRLTQTIYIFLQPPIPKSWDVQNINKIEYNYFKIISTKSKLINYIGFLCCKYTHSGCVSVHKEEEPIWRL